ncbi:YcgL domain-containing protein [Biformimicrobium ophioploci]|uniref:YcgL domain-containing protein MNKW57_16060 n=1 Tax=Biformimicrobium ophioploci TaxID=3036711 RepID=A0ABQ6LYY0_9GAMM|nr:YcgL domain-containing protein [Microbulbifer sp. NKW57]GMG87285.1 YcgL domain-containing protein [Microbulbifer sp. NKW57]
MKLICDIYKSAREEEMYLYVDKREGTRRIPGKLREIFGEPVHVVTMLLEPGKKLARADAAKVMAEIRRQGFYLQMPPAKDDEMREISLKNTKLTR